MTTTSIVGYDGSDGARAALAFATRLAADTGGDVIAADVYKSVPRLTGRGSARAPSMLIDEHNRRQAEDRLARDGVPEVVRCAVGAGSPAAGLHELAEDQDSALIAVGATHRGALGRIVPGSVGEHLLHGSPCPVAVIPADYTSTEIRTIGVGYDRRDESKAALRYAEDLARRLRARLVLIAVNEPIITYAAPGVPFYAGELEEELGKELVAELDRLVDGMLSDVDAEARVVTGPAATTLVETSKDGIDVLVVGSRGYGPARSVLVGSVARHVVDHAPCPVIVMPRGARADVGGAQAEAVAQHA